MMFHVEQALSLPPPAAPFEVVAGELGLHLSPAQMALTLAYCQELARWNATTSLVQASSWPEVARRHVAEGWAASLLLPPAIAPPALGPLRLLDIGSGGGIPALPMHVLRPDIEVTLLEPRERKAAFLSAVSRQHPTPRPSVRCRRLEDLDRDELWSVISFRGIRLAPEAVALHLEPGGRVIRFPGNPDEVRDTWVRSGFTCVAFEPLPVRPLRVEAWERK